MLSYSRQCQPSLTQTMKVLKLTLPFALATCAVTTCLSASADSTSNLVVNMQCRGGYNIQVWRNRTTNGLLYRSTNRNDKLTLYVGSSQKREGIQTYRFRNGNYEYVVWDGTLDSNQSGTLEVYKNDRILMNSACKKV